MSTLSMRAALVVAFGVLAVGCAKGDAPAPTSTVLSLTGTSHVAFALEAGRIVVAETGGGGGSFFSASVAGGGTFSGSSSGGSASFNGSVGGSSSFNGAVASGGAFSGSALLGPSCSPQSLCDFAFAFCEDLGGGNDCSSADLGACYTEVSSADFQAELAASGVPVGFICDLLDFLECVSQNVSSLTSGDDAAVAACADSSGLTDFFGSDLSNNNNATP